jgi:hypothetical protein
MRYYRTLPEQIPSDIERPFMADVLAGALENLVTEHLRMAGLRRGI